MKSEKLIINGATGQLGEPKKMSDKEIIFTGMRLNEKKDKSVTRPFNISNQKSQEQIEIQSMLNFTKQNNE
jgi:alpha-mannosidase